MVKYVLWFDETGKDAVNLVGGKVASLGELINAGFPIPPGFAVTSEAYKEFVRYNNLSETIGKMLAPLKDNMDDYILLEETSFRIRNLIESADMPKGVEEAISSAYHELEEETGVDNLRVAVRSSATAEDMDDASFAGQHDSYLNVKGVNQVINKVKRCWSSLFTPRVLPYRVKHGIKHHEALMGVAVQKMVNPRAAGVMFTLYPTTGRKDVVVIEAVWGLGEGLVSGLCTPDNYAVNKITFDVEEENISSKEMEIVYDKKQGKNIHNEVPKERRNVSCLSREELIELTKIGKKIEKYYSNPQDIEWAIDTDLKFPDNIFILQSRPETVWSRKKKDLPKPEGGVLDIIVSNIVTGKKLE
jgi:pyruvate,water dikinase